MFLIARGRSYLNELFHLEDKSRLASEDDYKFLSDYIKEVFETMALVNYPYPAEFFSLLPAWPVKVVNLYYNYTGTTKSLCANPSFCPSAEASIGDPRVWTWRYCTEMLMPQCSSGWPNDFYWKTCPFNVEREVEECKTWFDKIGFDRSMFRPRWITQNFGSEFPSASNIVFSNGYLDPWSCGGWSLTPKIEGSLVSIILQNGAHHYDLRGAHSNDTDEMIIMSLL
ncbi:unnamed protein product [Angiostrongylus costaricensis]|uniref:Lysosomal Pro-X carboxypeptidase n=1 Tax=Angiostrongylus costaricensis TaxID=334426 RepID=A0A0R3PCW5_ANGCS|nr:unnamed protein product [Angiostrongylus costaricensis]